MKPKLIGYWATTIVLALAVLPGGVAQLAQEPQTVASIVQLGYPVYFVTILGLWKVLGIIALLVPRFPRLKEWAYAGIFFEMSGAAVSHVVCHDSSWRAVLTVSLAVLAITSWALRPQSRVLGVLFPETERRERQN